MSNSRYNLVIKNDRWLVVDKEMGVVVFSFVPPDQFGEFGQTVNIGGSLNVAQDLDVGGAITVSTSPTAHVYMYCDVTSSLYDDRASYDTFETNLKAFNFDHTDAEERAYLSFVVPYNYKADTALELRLSLSTRDAKVPGSESIWNFYYKTITNGEAVSGWSSTGNSTCMMPGEADKCVTRTITLAVNSDIKPFTVIKGSLKRVNPSDYDKDIWLHAVGFVYEIAMY